MSGCTCSPPRGKLADGVNTSDKPDSKDVTVLLQAVRQGDAAAQNRLLPIVYAELRQLAGSYMRRERNEHTLQATALVHEAYVRLAVGEVAANDRAHFFALAAQTMRRVLVDHAKTRNRDKRGGGISNLTFDEAVFPPPQNDEALVDLDAALTRLATFDERGAQAVELMFFGGLDHTEACQVLGIGKTTLYEDLAIAKAWLAREVGCFNN